MSQGLPTALILGIDHFVAKKLAEELVNKDISVVGVGELVAGFSELKNFEWTADLESIEGEFNYVFDFDGDREDWAKIKGEKFTLISVDNESRNSYLSREAAVLDKDWRIVDARGVYGEKMGETGFLAKAIKQAVLNKNLELPSPNEEVRLLAVSDLVEAILRACFLSGTIREYFLVLGKEITFENLAKVLMDKAKMTRFKVMEKDLLIDLGNKKLAEVTEKQLRWKAVVDFSEGIEETLQYFFSMVDEENRQKKKDKTQEVIKKPIIEKANKRVFDVVVESESEIKINEAKVEEDKIIDVVEEVIETETPKLMVYKNEEEKETEEDVFEIQSLIKDKLEKKPKESDWIEEESEDFVELSPKESIKEVEKVDKQEVFLGEKKKKKSFRFWWVGLVLLLLISLMEPIKWGWATWKTVGDIKNIPEMIKNKKYNQVEKLTETRIEGLMKIDDNISEWGLNRFETMRNYQTGLKVLVDFLTLEKALPGLAKSADGINEAIFHDKEIDWNEELLNLEKGLMETENNMGILQARLSGDYNWLPVNWRMTLQKELKVIDETKQQIGLGKTVIKILPELLGLDGVERTYMVLLQNESELRPTGGFIGSYGLLNFKKGKLKSFEIKDIYEADGQLKGHVEPPWEIKTHLNEANWYMRDANWNADFVKASADIQWFLEKEVGGKVNGVIGIDLAAAKSILRATGGIYVPDFKETIDENNLYEQAEFYAETKFFPGSVQKASFLGALGKQLFEEIKNLKTDKSLVLVQSLVDLLEKNEIQISLNNKEAAKILTDLGWDGRIYNGKCVGENCIADYWYVVEANLGVNKANYFLRRNIEEAVDISGTSINRVLKINYENTAKNSNWPGGDYKNYIRLYLPKEVNLSQISVMDGYDTSIKKVYNSEEITTKEVDGKKEVGFLVTVPVLKKRIVEVRYSSSVNFGDKKEFTYMKYIQKQPGTGETGVVSLMSFGEEWQPIQVEPTASLVGGKLLFNMKLDKDIKMGVVLGR